MCVDELLCLSILKLIHTTLKSTSKYFPRFTRDIDILTYAERYEKGMTSSRIEKIFRELRDGLVPLIRQIDEAKAKMTSKSEPSALYLSAFCKFFGTLGLAEDSDHLKSYGPFDEVKQELLSKDVAKAMGFNFENGRLVCLYCCWFLLNLIFFLRILLYIHLQLLSLLPT